MKGFTAEDLEEMRLADEEIEREFKAEESEARKAYYKANREKILAKEKAWREANREKVAARYKAWYEANREKINEKRRRKYREKRIRNQDGV